MSTVDAEARGIKNGDTVLMSSPYGKVLRPAKVMPTVVPGAVALQDGSWTRIDEETGIDLGGNPNVLQAPQVLRRRIAVVDRARSCRWKSTTARWSSCPTRSVPSSCP